MRHATFLHPLKLSAETTFLDLALLLLLGVLEMPPVAKFDQVTGLVDFTLEPAKSTLDRLAITHFDPDPHSQLGCTGGSCRATKCG